MAGGTISSTDPKKHRLSSCNNCGEDGGGGRVGGAQHYILISIIMENYRIDLFILLFRAVPTAYGDSQARGRIGATAAGLYHSHSNTRSELSL